MKQLFVAVTQQIHVLKKSVVLDRRKYIIFTNQFPKWNLHFVFILSVKRENLEDDGGLELDIVVQGMASVRS